MLLFPIAIDGPLFAVTYILTRRDYESDDWSKFAIETDADKKGSNFDGLSIRSVRNLFLRDPHDRFGISFRGSRKR